MKLKALTWPEPVKSLILSEPDEMMVDEFVIKIGHWEKIFKIQGVK
jgi:hypothetical protein